ncbi:hypothetical protein P4O66_022088 [Electrophorus voltai]|uniref:Uncharacterized protein n=1 Tax=Electrophorus voltai TaxID=2609070 RepID=A0AAD9E2Y6_9TELE|nr:hypothetical protein P4O66_022088 [Electrophorus voltai]
MTHTPPPDTADGVTTGVDVPSLMSRYGSGVDVPSLMSRYGSGVDVPSLMSRYGSGVDVPSLMSRYGSGVDVPSLMSRYGSGVDVPSLMSRYGSGVDVPSLMSRYGSGVDVPSLMSRYGSGVDVPSLMSRYGSGVDVPSLMSRYGSGVDVPSLMSRYGSGVDVPSLMSRYSSGVDVPSLMSRYSSGVDVPSLMSRYSSGVDVPSLMSRYSSGVDVPSLMSRYSSGVDVPSLMSRYSSGVDVPSLMSRYSSGVDVRCPPPHPTTGHRLHSRENQVSQFAPVPDRWQYHAAGKMPVQTSNVERERERLCDRQQDRHARHAKRPLVEVRGSADRQDSRSPRPEIIHGGPLWIFVIPSPTVTPRTFGCAPSFDERTTGGSFPVTAFHYVPFTIPRGHLRWFMRADVVVSACGWRRTICADSPAVRPEHAVSGGETDGRIPSPSTSSNQVGHAEDSPPAISGSIMFNGRSCGFATTRAVSCSLSNWSNLDFLFFPRPPRRPTVAHDEAREVFASAGVTGLTE